MGSNFVLRRRRIAAQNSQLASFAIDTLRYFPAPPGGAVTTLGARVARAVEGYIERCRVGIDLVSNVALEPHLSPSEPRLGSADQNFGSFLRPRAKGVAALWQLALNNLAVFPDHSICRIREKIATHV